MDFAESDIVIDIRVFNDQDWKDFSGFISFVESPPIIYTASAFTIVMGSNRAHVYVPVEGSDEGECWECSERTPSHHWAFVKIFGLVTLHKMRPDLTELLEDLKFTRVA